MFKLCNSYAIQPCSCYVVINKQSQPQSQYPPTHRNILQVHGWLFVPRGHLAEPNVAMDPEYRVGSVSSKYFDTLTTQSRNQPIPKFLRGEISLHALGTVCGWYKLTFSSDSTRSFKKCLSFFRSSSSFFSLSFI